MIGSQSTFTLLRMFVLFLHAIFYCFILGDALYIMACGNMQRVLDQGKGYGKAKGGVG